MHVWIRLAAAGIACAASLAFGQASSGDPLRIQLETRKVVPAGAGAAETFAPAGTAQPGETLEYAVTYRNTGREALHKLEATLPIPPHTEFVAGSARPASARASVDGSAYAPLPLVRKVRREGGEAEERVPLREYRYLRWSVPTLAAGEAVTFHARVRVLDEGTASPPAANR